MEEKNIELDFLRKPLVFLLCAMAPQLLLFAGGWYIYSLVAHDESLNLELWRALSIALAILFLSFSGLGIFRLLTKRSLPWRLSLLYLPVYIAWLYWMLSNFHRLIPSNIPRWCLSGEEFLLAPGGLLMPGILYSLLLIVYRFTPVQTKGWKNLLAALIIPGGWYLFFHVVIPARRVPESPYWTHALVLLFVISAASFLFLLLRWLVVCARNRSPRKQQLLLLFFGLVFPLLGLYLDNSMPYLGQSPLPLSYADFSHPLFAIFAVLNGLALLLSPPSMPFLRLVLFCLRCALLPFTLYFFLAFLPLIPFALVLITWLGVGLLVLTPTLLFFLHLDKLWNDYLALRTLKSRTLLLAAAVTSFVLLPLAISLSFLADRLAIDQALRALRSPDYSVSGTSLNRQRLTRTVNNIMHHKHKQNNFFAFTPFLDAYYRYLVLDNLTLSEATLTELNSLFELNIEQAKVRSAPSQELPRARLATKTVATIPLGEDYLSVIALTIEPDGFTGRAQEYVSEFSLPPGAWISGFTLDIEGKPIPGMIVEKQAAQWIYRQIVNERKDPALLYYTGPNSLRLHVFPVLDEGRKVTISIIHRSPIRLLLENEALDLGQNITQSVEKTELVAGKMLFVPESIKRSLPRISRQPYLEFIVECQASGNDWQAAAIQSLISQSKPDNFFVTIGSASFTRFTSQDPWQEGITNCQRDGKLNLDYALKSMLLRNHLSSRKSFPVPILLANGEPDIQAPKDMEPFLALAPELQHLDLLNKESTLTRYQLPTLAQMGSHHKALPKPLQVLVWPSAKTPQAFFSDIPGAGEFFLHETAKNSNLEAASGQWGTGLELRGLWLEQVYYPSRATHSAWRNLIEKSTRNGILVPSTSYIVLETELQREALRRLQQQRLEGQSTLDAGEARRMSEPGILMVLLGALAARRLGRRQGNLR